MSSNYGKLKVGTLMECVKSESPGYKKGRVYTVVKQDDKLGLIGDDNYFDPFSLIVSSFKVADANKQAIEHLKVVK